MRTFLPQPLLCALLLGLTGSPAWGDSDEVIVQTVNRLLRQSWTDNEISPSQRSEDGEFARRVSLDIVGRIPSYVELTNFLDDESPTKRKKFVDRLLDDEDYIRNWTNVWANLLVGRANRQGDRAALERWLRNAIYRNLPYDQFVRELISAEGSPDENGAVAFLGSHLNDEAVPATAITARVFLGMQVQCTQCHNHPFNDWQQSQFWSLNAFFRGTENGGRRGARSLVDKPSMEITFFEKRSGEMKATERKFVDGTRVAINKTVKPRVQLAKLVTDPDKPQMSQAIVNRLWGHFFGHGFTKPVDDMGPHNAATHPELLNYLAVQFREARYDVKRLIRWITASEAYQLTSRIGEANAADNPGSGNAPLFSRMYLKPFRAEQLYDSLLVATEADKVRRTAEEAQRQRAAWLRQFVQTFGTDENDESSTFNGTIPQALVLMNGQLIQTAISGDQGSFLRRVLESPDGDLRATKKTTNKQPRRPRRGAAARPANLRRNIPKKIETLYLVALARKPTEAELKTIDQVFRESGARDPIQGMQDVFWALLNSNEFIINH